MEFLYDIKEFFRAGGGMGTLFMGVIFIVWAIGIAIASERVVGLIRLDVDGPSLWNELTKHILKGKVQEAIKACSGSAAALARVLKHGLQRSHQSKEQIQNALDSTALEVIPKVEARLSYLQLIANVSTLVGLLGTIFGLIESFKAVAAAEDPAQKAQLLSDGISTAMNTTAFGLISAITIMVIHTILSNKSEKIISNIDQFSVKLIDLVGTKQIEEQGE